MKQPTTPNLLVVYQSVDGQTERIATRLTEHLRAAGAVVTLATARMAPPPDRFDAVVVGDSIHAGQHTKELTTYLSDHATALASVPTALFQVCLTSADPDPARQAAAGEYIRQLLEATGLEPALVARFAGALRYTTYGRLKRAFMRKIAAKGGQPTDTSRDHEMTDWQQVEGFAADVLALSRSTPV